MRHLRRRRNEDGAAAVEFALLFPIFVMICFGTVTAGLSLWHHISMTQAARDAARYGSTLPVTTTLPTPPGEYDIDTYLAQVLAVAVRESGWADTSSVGGEANGHGFVCVAWVQGATGSTLATKRATAGSAAGAGITLPTDETCYDDGRTDARVQVFVRRNGEFHVVFFGRQWDMNTRSSIPYEREVPST